MKTLSLDLETYCDLSLPQVGVYRYAADASFEVLLLAYSVDGGPVQIVDLAQGEEVPPEILDALGDPTVEKWAYNAAFERVCLSAHLGTWLAPTSWRCSLVWASSIGLNASLANAASALRLTAQKMEEGRDLIRKFSQPIKPSKANGMRVRNFPADLPKQWGVFKEYCVRDVEVEQAIQERLAKAPSPEWGLYELDQQINDRGIGVDVDLARAAIRTSEDHRTNAIARAREITGLDNPNSPIQLLSWIRAAGVGLASMARQDVLDALQTATGDVAEVLRLRLELAKSSVKKYQAMERAAGPDHRARGLLQFMGAGRTGRWAGRLIQVQNLPRQSQSDLDVARDLVKRGHGGDLETLWGSTPDILSELVRTALIPAPGKHFVVADFSAIEARVLAWLAGERWVLDLFESGGDIYCETGSRMFGQAVTKASPLRQKAKVAVLACGYQGGPGALVQMGALRMGLDESELKPIVDAWRTANPRIVGFWYDVQGAAKRTIESGYPSRVGRIIFSLESGVLYISLPSGRKLSYPAPRLGENRFGGESITHLGVGVNRKWQRLETYGGKLAENIVQATARDILAEAMLRLEAADMPIVMHVHDEVVIEADQLSGASVDEVCALMSQSPAWADGLPLAAEGFTCDYYQKG